MHDKKIKAVEIVFIIFLIGIISMQYSQAKNNPNEEIQVVKYVDNIDENFAEENFIKEKSHTNHDLAEENFIKIKDKKEEASRSIESRRKGSISKVITKAHDKLGKSYSYGKTGPYSYDCSGLIYSIYLDALDIKLDRTSREQSKNGYLVKRENLMPGDLVFFNTSGGGISHVGLYIGKNQMIHASSKNKKIIIANIDSKYFKSKYVTARRIIE